MPFAPLPFLAALHAWQDPLHSVEQHTPSTQKPDWHCEFELQLPPGGSSGLHVLLAPPVQ